MSPARLGMLLGLVSGAMLIAGCSVPTGGRVIGGQPVSIQEMPTFPGAVELSATDSRVIEPLFGPAQRETPPFIGLGIEVDKSQRDFRVPKETTFEEIKAFYADKLQAAGWREDAAMRVLTEALNADSRDLQGAVWLRVDQSLLIALATDPTSGEKELTLSLATH